MSTTTKGHIVTRALAKLGISGITAPANNPDIVKALYVLEETMSELDSRNICTNFSFEDDPDPATESGIAKQFINAAINVVACRVAPEFGREASSTTQRQATQGISNWGARVGRVNQIDYPMRQPRGSGNTFRFLGWYRYFRIEANAPIECDTLQLRVGETNTFTIDFTPYLRQGETIASTETQVANGIRLNSIDEADGVYTLNVTGLLSGWQIIQIKFTTSLGRANPHQANFDVIGQPPI